MISLKNVTCSLGGQVVLNSVNLTVKSGEAVLLTGANGSGKTTLLRLLNGLVFPVSGEYRFQGELITASALRRHRLAKAFHQRLGYVCDAEIDLEDGKIVSLIVPGQKKLGGLLSGDDDYILPWESISRLGEDIILAEVAAQQPRRRREKRQNYL